MVRHYGSLSPKSPVGLKNGLLGVSKPPIGLKRLSSSASSGNSEEENDDVEVEEEERRKIIERLLSLANHLAGCVVEFLIEEVEQKNLQERSDAHTGGGRNGFRNELDGSILDDTTDYEDEEDDIVEEIFPTQRVRGGNSLSPPSSRDIGGAQSGGNNSFGQQLYNSNETAPRKANSVKNFFNASLYPPVSKRQMASSLLHNTSASGRPKNDVVGSLLSSGNTADGLEDNAFLVADKLSPKDVPKPIRRAKSLRDVDGNDGLVEEHNILGLRSKIPENKLDVGLSKPNNGENATRLANTNLVHPGRNLTPGRGPAAKLCSGHRVQSIGNINLSIFENPKDNFTRGNGRAACSQTFGTGPQRDVTSMRSNSVKNIMQSMEQNEDRKKISSEKGVQRNNSGIRMQRMLEKRTVERTKSGSSTGSNSRKDSPVRRRTVDRRGVERRGSGIRGLNRIPDRTKSGKRGGSAKLKRQFSLMETTGTLRSSSHGMFAVDKVTNKLSHDTRKQKRIFKVQNAMRKLMRTTPAASIADSSEYSDSDFDDDDMEGRVVSLTFPCGISYEAVLLFVDISGFTKLSQALKVENLSKTINDYFQLIVEQVNAFDGDILKFAGDAVFVEWRATTSSVLKIGENEKLKQCRNSGEGLGQEKAVITAAACAARIIDKCADYKVFDEKGQSIATLNLHCAIGLGKVTGVHLGNLEDRMEYFIIGDPIKQVANAMDMGKMGEVVASPECLRFLGVDFPTQPEIILTKTNKFSNPKLMFVKPDNKKKGIRNHKFAERFKSLDLHVLKSLQKLMLPYIHPVVVANHLFQRGYGAVKDTKFQERFNSEAEIRDIFTIFIQPILSCEMSQDSHENFKVLKTLHDVLVTVNKELRRFKGHLRQYTVDDKGIVLIANFGLRGSTFPQMVERLAMPFATNVQHILKAKLDVDCHMGATFGKAYVGVVGGSDRHEYSVLGPSVNLAARLMGNPQNNGFLVDEEVKRKASNRGYEALAPVKAKGYRSLVPIFQPMLEHRRSWGSGCAHFVGRSAEVKKILKFAEDIIDANESTKMVWVSSESGFGKSALLAHATEKIQDLCGAKCATHVGLCHVCSDADSLQPLSVLGPLCLDILAFVRRGKNESKYDQPKGFDEIAKLARPGAEQAPFRILGACRDADVPDYYIRLICRLLLTNTWPPEADDATRDAETREVARYIVSFLLQSTIHLDLILLAIDDIPHSDEISWAVVEFVYRYGCNFMFLLASRPITGEDMNIDVNFWEQLFTCDIKEGNMIHIELEALTQTELELLVQEHAKKNSAEIAAGRVAKEVFVQSGGMPQLASEILDRKFSAMSGQNKKCSPKPNTAKKEFMPKNSLRSLGLNLDRQHSDASLSSASAGSGSFANVGEHMLHRMDVLSPETRTHVNLGAILGPSFESLDVVRVMERYRGISDEEKEQHCRSVLESLEQAAECGILEEDLSGAGMSMSFCAGDESFLAQDRITYKFTHADWQKNILKIVLDSWKREMYQLLAESLEDRFDFNSRNPDRAIRHLFEPFKGGKKKGKNISVASELALKIGKQLIGQGKGRQSLEVYQKALNLWLEKKDDKEVVLVMEDEEEQANALPVKFEDDDREYVSRLYVAMGRCALHLMDRNKSGSSFQASANLFSDGQELKDKAVLFPALSGQFYSLRLERKLEFETELDEVYNFVGIAEKHENEIHHLEALAMEAEIFGRKGDFRKALEATVDLRQKYDIHVHSQLLVDFYGEDHCSQAIGQSAGWHFRLCQQDKALAVCDFVEGILPSLAGNHVFPALYPILWVLKDAGQIGRALSLCQKYLAYANEGDNDGNKFSPFSMLFKPIRVLLDLSLSGDQIHATTIKEYTDWALVASNGEYNAAFNIYTANLARNADSIMAEVCLILATYRNSFHAKSALLSKASSLVRSSTKVTKYMAVANAEVQSFATDKKYENL